MKRFVMWAFFVSIILGVVFSPFASSFPDGLERVAENLGFIHKDMGSILKGPIPDYAVPFVKDDKLATSLAGLIGTFAAFFFAYGVGYLLKKTKGV